MIPFSAIISVKHNVEVSPTHLNEIKIANRYLTEALESEEIFAVHGQSTTFKHGSNFRIWT